MRAWLQGRTQFLSEVDTNAPCGTAPEPSDPAPRLPTGSDRPLLRVRHCWPPWRVYVTGSLTGPDGAT
ncbi:hypothetical protein NDU88_002518 [Pleurodeles waltl]|uniref:Uncharacterized protein n=1 Tax=Pleurodeles waltl TaxID=8319 RepID=A0AAV7UWE5_PLEWA|nr:hypothetical protein NDU88_002518 [Pleurodeles waltl]